MEALIKALIETQKDLKPIKKDRTNPITHSSYVTLDAILEELLPKLNKHGLFLSQEPVSKQDESGGYQLGVRTIIYHESGQKLEHEPLFMPIEANGRMNMSQSAGSVITYVKRYAIGAIFGIVADEDDDGNSQNRTNGGEKKPPKPMTLEDAQKFKLTFGKHKGVALGNVRKVDSDYLNWLYKREQTDEEIKLAIKIMADEEKRKRKEEEGENVDDSNGEADKA